MALEKLIFSYAMQLGVGGKAEGIGVVHWGCTGALRPGWGESFGKAQIRGNWDKVENEFVYCVCFHTVVYNCE